MRVEVYEDEGGGGRDVFLFGAYAGNKVNLTLDKKKLQKVHDALVKQKDFVAKIIAGSNESNGQK